MVVHSYPAMQWLGLTLGVFAGDYAARVSGMNSFRVFVATILLLIPALAGARVLHVATHFHYYRANPRSIWDTRQGGAAQYGGILLAVPMSVPLLSALALPFGAFWDVAAITIMVGMMFTRIGCFLNGCCAGRESDSWIALDLPDIHGKWKRRYPTQLLEAAWALVLLFAGALVWPSLPFEGSLFLFIACGYALGRLILESIRDVPRTFTIHHAISILIIVVSAAVISTRAQQ